MTQVTSKMQSRKAVIGNGLFAIGFIALVITFIYYSV